MDLEIRHLRLVAGIADAGSMTKAAGRLHLTQSALSHQLRDIEGRLGTALFTRLGRSMVLTEPGRRVLDAARRVIGEVQRAEEDVRRLAGHGEGTIRVCTECYTGYHWLGAILAAFQTRHPRTRAPATSFRTHFRQPCLQDKGAHRRSRFVGQCIDRTRSWCYHQPVARRHQGPSRALRRERLRTFEGSRQARPAVAREETT